MQSPLQFPTFPDRLFMVISLALARVCFANMTSQGRTDSESDWAKFTFVRQIYFILVSVLEWDIFVSAWSPNDGFRHFLNSTRIGLHRDNLYCSFFASGLLFGYLFGHLLAIMNNLSYGSATEVPFFFVSDFIQALWLIFLI